MKISKLLTKIDKNIQRIGDKDPDVINIEFDSRRVQKGTLFFALKGIHTDGHKYIDKAIDLGAEVICICEDLDTYNPEVVYLKVEDTKKTMSTISSALYNYPSSELKVIGVTGTDGKSTTVSLLDQLLELSGKKSGYLSTISFKSGDIEEKNKYRQSTPESSQIHEILREMINNGKEYAIVESTSHGLSHKTCRLKDVDYNVGILTNITQEHLEFHGTLEQYRSDKGNLFRALSKSEKENVFGVVNLDDPESSNFIEYASPKPVYTYSLIDSSADLFVKDLNLTPEGSDITLLFNNNEYKTRLNLPGKFNVENLMATLLAVHKLSNVPFEELISYIPKLKSVKGRMNAIKSSTGFSVMVDYAHTPGSFRKVLPAIKQITEGKLIVVFGSAGERDTVKRPIQGEIADQFADTIILTDEDPRLEDSLTIINDIKAGIKTKTLGDDLLIIPNRVKAIEKAITMASKGDMILTLGKGHESTIEYSHGSESWNEFQVIKDILSSKKLG